MEIRLPWLKVKLGDIVEEIDSKRMGFVFKKGILGSKNAFYVRWLDDIDKLSGYLSRNTQQKLRNTGKNIYDNSSSD